MVVDEGDFDMVVYIVFDWGFGLVGGWIFGDCGRELVVCV